MPRYFSNLINGIVILALGVAIVFVAMNGINQPELSQRILGFGVIVVMLFVIVLLIQNPIIEPQAGTPGLWEVIKTFFFTESAGSTHSNQEGGPMSNHQRPKEVELVPVPESERVFQPESEEMPAGIRNLFGEMGVATNDRNLVEATIDGILKRHQLRINQKNLQTEIAVAETAAQHADAQTKAHEAHYKLIRSKLSSGLLDRASEQWLERKMPRLMKTYQRESEKADKQHELEMARMDAELDELKNRRRPPSIFEARLTQWQGEIDRFKANMQGHHNLRQEMSKLKVKIMRDIDNLNEDELPEEEKELLKQQVRSYADMTFATRFFSMDGPQSQRFK